MSKELVLSIPSNQAWMSSRDAGASSSRDKGHVSRGHMYLCALEGRHVEDALARLQMGRQVGKHTQS